MSHLQPQARVTNTMFEAGWINRSAPAPGSLELHCHQGCSASVGVCVGVVSLTQHTHRDFKAQLVS